LQFSLDFYWENLAFILYNFTDWTVFNNRPSVYSLNFKEKFWNLFDLTFAEASQAPDTKVLMSGESDRDMTSPVCPMNGVHCCPVSMSHSALYRKITL
jgi:hypothetical protein